MPGTPVRRLGRWALVALVVLGSVSLGACSSSSSDDQQQQVDDLQSQLDAANAELESTQSQLDQANADLESTQADLTATQDELQTTKEDLASTEKKLSSTEEDLASTEAELLDAQAQLAQVGEVVLRDGTYTGPILGAKTNPRVIVFNASGNFRVAEVATDATITSGGGERTLQQLARILASTDPAQAELANGNYRVIVRNGLVTSIRKSQP
jgi:TolA-binding protein